MKNILYHGVIAIWTFFAITNCLAADAIPQIAPASPNSLLSTKSMDTLVRNGTIVLPSEFMEVVAIELSNDRGTFKLCSGALIAPTWVLSAAHCVRKGMKPIRIVVGASFYLAPVLNGKDFAYLPPNSTMPDAQSIAVASYVVMNETGIQRGEDIWGLDLLLINLKKPALSPARTIAISSLEGLASAKVARVVGFGENGHKNHGEKLSADIDIALHRCKPETSVGFERSCAADAEMILRHPTGKFDLCPGDSGGPVYVRTGPQEYRLIAISSRALNPYSLCGGGTFVTLLDKERWQWIKSVTNLPDPVGILTPVLPSTQSSCDPNYKTPPGMDAVC